MRKYVNSNKFIEGIYVCSAVMGGDDCYLYAVIWSDAVSYCIFSRTSCETGKY